MKQLVPFVEGPGDVTAVPLLLRRLLAHHELQSVIGIGFPFRVGEINSFSSEDKPKWNKLLRAALKRPDTGGVLLLLDGDTRRWRRQPFCPVTAARILVKEAVDAGAGVVFSLAVVFARQEFETWLLAGVESLAGREMSDKRPGVRAGARPPEGDLELAPRDAKRELGKLMQFGYKPTLDQADLTKLVDLELVRKSNLTAFLRLERVICQLAEAFRAGKHIATPVQPAK
jgi:Domain of unknown function (DUF4276)